MSEQKFFIVWNPEGENPKYRHSNFESAREEADRLALSNPDQEFYVLEAHEYMVRRTVIHVVLDNIPSQEKS